MEKLEIINIKTLKHFHGAQRTWKLAKTDVHQERGRRGPVYGHTQDT